MYHYVDYKVYKNVIKHFSPLSLSEIARIDGYYFKDIEDYTKREWEEIVLEHDLRNIIEHKVAYIAFIMLDFEPLFLD